jgi:hypothetical protein
MTLAFEALKTHTRAEKANNAPQAKMAAAQIALCHRMIEYYQEQEDWSDFSEKLAEVVALQQSLYREARAKNDRNFSLITLGRLRALATLSRRLADTDRQENIIDNLPPYRLLH